MASPTSQPSSSAASSEELSAVQVLDSNEPLVTASSSVSSCIVQVIDSSEPLVLTVSAPDDAGPGFSTLAVAVPSRSADTDPLTDSSESDSDEENSPQNGSSSRKRDYTADELRNLWCWKRVYRLLNTEAQCIAFAEERGLIPSEKMCNYHRRPMSLTVGVGQLGKFRCRKSNCRNKSISRAAGTWFEHARLPINVIFQLMYGYSDGTPYHRIRKEVAEDGGPAITLNTFVDWYNNCRKAVVKYEREHSDVMGEIDGPGKNRQLKKFRQKKINIDFKEWLIETSWRRNRSAPWGSLRGTN